MVAGTYHRISAAAQFSNSAGRGFRACALHIRIILKVPEIIGHRSLVISHLSYARAYGASSHVLRASRSASLVISHWSLLIPNSSFLIPN